MKAIIHFEVKSIRDLVDVINRLSTPSVKAQVLELEDFPIPSIHFSELKAKKAPERHVNSSKEKTREEKHEIKRHSLICRGCGEPYFSKFATSVVCSTKCYWKYKKSLQGQEKEIESNQPAYKPIIKTEQSVSPIIEETAIPINEEPDLDLSDRRDKVECRVCGFEFHPKTSGSKYCSPKCSRIGKIMDEKLSIKNQ